MDEPRRWLISPQELNNWLDKLASSRKLIAPHQSGGVLFYHQLEKGAEVDLSPGKPVLSVKEVFFPPTESLFTIQKIGQQVRLNVLLPETPTAVFGVRPCEARGIRRLDAVFLDTPPVDPYYASRRENTVLIGLACQEMDPTCFCTSVGGSLTESKDMDVMLYSEDGSYLVEAVTQRGYSLIPAEEWKKTEVEPYTPRIDPGVAVPEPQSIPWQEHFEDTFWQDVAERCLSCRACAYVCPTCRCFTVRDEALGAGEFERIRCWDSCEGLNYRRVAGGKKARPEKGERLRNRFFCKFYYYPEQTGLATASACTGCGRCIEVCPVGVDITEVLIALGRQA